MEVPNKAEAPVVVCFGKTTRGRFPGDAETWVAADIANTLNAFDLARIATCANELVVAFPANHSADGTTWKKEWNATI